MGAALERGEVEVDGKRVERSVILQAGQTITWHRPPWDEGDVPTNYTILHEDESIIAVDKPGGLPTMPAGGYLNHTLLTLMRETYPEASPLHRLGRHTSGLVLFARNRAAASALSRAWREHTVKKTYRALARGETRTESVRDRRADRSGAASAARNGGGCLRGRQAVPQRGDGPRRRARSHVVPRRHHHGTPAPGAHPSRVCRTSARGRSLIRGGRRAEAPVRACLATAGITCTPSGYSLRIQPPASACRWSPLPRRRCRRARREQQAARPSPRKTNAADTLAEARRQLGLGD